MDGLSFLEQRHDWLKVTTIDLPTGGWDVVLRIDGTYYEDSVINRQDLVDYFARWVVEEVSGGRE